MKVESFVEFQDLKVDQKQLVETAKEIWKNNGNKVKDLSNIELYLKPEERKCYYVFNNDASTSSSFDV